MKHVLVGGIDRCAIVQGAWHIEDKTPEQVADLVRLQLDHGVNFWDHADIYGGGRCESVFGEALRRLPAGTRDRLVIQSKCGIKPGAFTQYDFSREHILASVNGSLERLGIERLDYLLLHRPDLLMEPEEVASAFDTLHEQGKVAHFGVSNCTPGQIELLKTCVRQPLEVNQLQLSLAHTLLLDSGANLNLGRDAAVNRDAGVLDYCRVHGITIQCYSPFQYGFFEGSFIDSPRYPELNAVLGRLAERYGTTKNGIAAAWLLRHPANMQVLVGTTNPERLAAIDEAADIVLTRAEWYELYAAAGNQLP